MALALHHLNSMSDLTLRSTLQIYQCKIQFWHQISDSNRGSINVNFKVNTKSCARAVHKPSFSISKVSNISLKVSPITKITLSLRDSPMIKITFFKSLTNDQITLSLRLSLTMKIFERVTNDKIYLIFESLIKNLRVRQRCRLWSLLWNSPWPSAAEKLLNPLTKLSKVFRCASITWFDVVSRSVTF